jgi:O-antigen/teichoic acid export membrane protein
MYGHLTVGQLLSRFSSTAAVYGVSLAVTRVGWILLLPVYWTRLTPADYGIIGIAQVVQTFLTPVLSLGLYDSVQRFYLEWAASERRRRVGALWAIAIGWSALVCGALLLTGDAVFPHILSQVDFQPYLVLAIGTAFFANFLHFPLAILRTQERAAVYSSLSIASFASQALLTILLVVVYEMGVEGYLLGTLMSAALWALVSIVMMAKEATVRFRIGDVREPLRYALPTVPLAILDGTTSLLDRFFLDKHVGLVQIGLYNLGNQFGGAFNMFNLMMKTSWTPFLYRVVEERDDAPNILSQFSVYYLTVLAVPALAIALLSKDLIEVIGDERFHGVYAFVPSFVLLYYMQSIAAAMGRGMDLAKKTALWPAVACVSLLIALVALSVFVPRWGAPGAIAALLCAGLARVLTQVSLSVHFYPRPLMLGTLAQIWAIAGFFFAIGYFVQWPQLWVSILAKAALVCAAAVALARVCLGRELFSSIMGSLPFGRRVAKER